MNLPLPANDKWKWREFQPWRQDTQEWENEETGEVFLPTFSWISVIRGMRTFDNQCFYLRLVASGEEGKPLDERQANFIMECGIEEFDSFSDCACIVGKNCERHWTS